MPLANHLKMGIETWSINESRLYRVNWLNEIGRIHNVFYLVCRLPSGGGGGKSRNTGGRKVMEYHHPGAWI